MAQAALKRTWTNILGPQLLTGILCGGLGGAAFTWFIQRPNPTIITYAVTTTSLGADPAVKGVVPDLKLHVDTEEVAVIHTHNVEFGAQQGQFLEHADVAIVFHSPVRFFGRVLAEAPSPVQHVDCKQTISSVLCSISPVMVGKGYFRVVVATDQKQAPTAVMVARNADLVKAEDYLSSTRRVFGVDKGNWLLALIMVGVLAAGIIIGVSLLTFAIKPILAREMEARLDRVSNVLDEQREILEEKAQRLNTATEAIKNLTGKQV